LVTTAFLAYYLAQHFHVTLSTLGWLFAAVTIIQAVSVAAAPRLARRFGLVPTMVWTHLPSNVLLAAVAFAPTFPVAAALLLGRTTLSQMDVPARQALVMTVVTPPERTAAAAVTNGARYAIRPLGPVLAGVLQHLAMGMPLLVAGSVKGAYDLSLWRWARGRGVVGSEVTRDREDNLESPADVEYEQPMIEEAIHEMGDPGSAQDRPDRVSVADP
jgi:MFS family permease